MTSPENRLQNSEFLKAFFLLKSFLRKLMPGTTHQILSAMVRLWRARNPQNLFFGVKMYLGTSSIWSLESIRGVINVLLEELRSFQLHQACLFSWENLS